MKYNFPKLYQRSVFERLSKLNANEVIDEKMAFRLLSRDGLLSIEQADKMVENVIGVFSLPIGLGLNFLINDKEYIVPMVTEEPSIIAGVSSAAKTIRTAGGFVSTSQRSLLIGQVVISNILDPLAAEQKILEHKKEIIDTINILYPRMVARGGGAVNLEIHHQVLSKPSLSNLITVHLIVDTRDAMGANFVNGMCEKIAPVIKKIIGGEILMQILSNLHTQSIVRIETSIPTKLLTGKGFNGNQIRDRIVMASQFAQDNPYRAATHNKGIMNGIDAVAIATGNDWRAIEASAHAYAGLGLGYKPLSFWSMNTCGDLKGELTIPIKVGIINGSLQSNPIVKDMLKILNVKSAQELAVVMAAVGLAQNFAILRVLVTEGIQEGHMPFQFRSVAATPDNK